MSTSFVYQTAFLTRSENIRAYISRSFTNPMWHDILGNKASLLRASARTEAKTGV